MAILDFFKKGVKDPVCEMVIDPGAAQYQTVRNGKTYYFCSAECKGTFDKGPSKKSTKGGCCG